MIAQVITVRLVQTQNHGNLRPADGAPTVGGEIWCSFLSTHAFLLGNGQTYATRGVPYYRASRIFSVPDLKCIRQTDMVKLAHTLLPRNHQESCYQFCCMVNRGTMGVNSLPKNVTRQRRDCDLNPGPSAPESSTLTPLGYRATLTFI